MKFKSTAFAVAMTLASSLALAPRGHAQAGPSDTQIVGIVLAADDIDIKYGKLALAKSKDKHVREFAQQMITDHSAVQKSVQELAAKLGVTAQDSDTSNALKTQSQEITAKLKTLKGAAFDKTYIDNEVAYHKAVTDAVAGVLIPNANNAELKAALEGAQPLFLGHLEHARKVQSGVDKMGAM
jgi:putative membrane protein